jgi:hypothetical protein
MRAQILYFFAYRINTLEARKNTAGALNSILAVARYSIVYGILRLKRPLGW